MKSADSRLIPWLRDHPAITRNTLVVLCAAPLAGAARWLLAVRGWETDPILGAVLPAAGIALGLLIAHLIASALGVRRPGSPRA